MIKNERQYRITKAEAEKFQGSLEGWDPTPPDGIDPVIHAAQKSALESQLRDLKREVAEYEALRSGRQPVLEVELVRGFSGRLGQGPDRGGPQPEGAGRAAGPEGAADPEVRGHRLQRRQPRADDGGGQRPRPSSPQGGVPPGQARRPRRFVAWPCGYRVRPQVYRAPARHEAGPRRNG